jgi:uncharacterized protein (TIGR03435 family)
MKFAMIAIAAGILNAQAPEAPQWQVAAGGKMAFEVASIKPAAPGAAFIPPNFAISSEDAYAETGGRLTADFPVTVYIEFAYKLWLTREQRQAMVAHLPKWVTSDSFVIQAKAPISNPTKDQMRLMMQSLLANRFSLALHFETREVPVLALTLVKPGKTGPKLIPHAEGPPCDAPPSPDLFAPRCGATFSLRSKGVRRGGSRNTTMDMIAAALTGFGNLDRPVVDRTGLDGKFDYRLDWTPEPSVSAPPNPDAPPADLPETTFLQALREQLGLKLESTKGPIQTLVIDHIDRPSEN